MTNRLSSFFTAPLALAAALILGGGQQADAGFQVTLSAGGASKTIVDGGAGDVDGDANSILDINEVIGGYQFKATLTSTNTPGGGTIAFVDGGVGSIRDIGSPNPNTTVSIYASANGFMAPSAPPALTALTSATIQFLPPTTPGNDANPVSVMSYVDTTNSLSTTASGTLIGSASGSITAGGPNNNAALNDTQTIASLSPPYAVNLLLSASLIQSGLTVDLDGSVRLEASAVPEPGTLAMAALAMPMLGLGCYIRRRSRA